VEILPFGNRNVILFWYKGVDIFLCFLSFSFFPIPFPKLQHTWLAIHTGLRSTISPDQPLDTFNGTSPSFFSAFLVFLSFVLFFGGVVCFFPSARPAFCATQAFLLFGLTPAKVSYPANTSFFSQCAGSFFLFFWCFFLSLPSSLYVLIMSALFGLSPKSVRPPPIDSAFSSEGLMGYLPHKRTPPPPPPPRSSFASFVSEVFERLA